jgi:predicted SAM-dependent methyltransferase
VGASLTSDKRWLPTSIDFLNLLKESDWQRYFRPNSIDAILAEHVWEHLTAEEGLIAAKNCFQYLRPGGYIRVAVPDGLHPDPSYIEYVRVGGSGPGSDDHKVLCTYESLRSLFEAADFNVHLLEYFDEKGEFHFKEWDPENGKIHRSKLWDKRNKGGKLNYTSIIIDAFKSGTTST